MTQITMEVIQQAIPPREFASLHPALEGTNWSAYENVANYVVKVLMGVAARNPVAFKAALDAFRADPYGREIDNLMTEEERYLTIGDPVWGASDYQWGWAVGTVAYFLEQDPVPNPAILTVVIANA